MTAVFKKPFFFIFSVAFFFVINAGISFAGNSNSHFQCPHFFAVAPDNPDNFVLHFSKGLMQFSDRQISFEVIKAGSEKQEQMDPDAMMHAPEGVFENISLDFVNANPCIPVGIEPLASRSNYFIGNNSDKWKKDLQNYNALQYVGLYHRIDLKYYVVNGDVKYDYTIFPGGSVADIEVKYSGIQSLVVDKNGTLCISTKLTELKDYLPKSYQVIDGKEIPVKVRYRLKGKFSVGFVAEEYNKNYPLIIDPALIYSTFVGGSGDDFEYTGGISLDATGNIYVTGRTMSANFPVTAGALQNIYKGNMDAFVFKLNPSGTALIFSTFIGGSGLDAGYTTKIDPVTNDIYVAGTTGSANFPTTAGAFQTTYSGGIYDPFLFKLNASGNSFIYSTLMGNAQDDYGAGLDIDDLGNAYLVGQSSGVYPTTAGAYQATYGGGPWDVFITKFNTTGTGVIFSTMLGGSGEDHSHSIKVDSNYDVYIEGMAKAGFPTTAGCYDPTFNGGQWDMYVTKMNSTGTALIFSTYVGGPGADWTWNGMEIDNGGNTYCTGYVQNGFPTTPGAYQTSYGGGNFDVIVFKLNAAGNSLIYSTYLGGPGNDQGWGICLNPANDVFVTGLCSFGYPYTPCAWDTTFNGLQDAFISYLDATGSSLLYSSYIGGADYDQGYNIIDNGNFVYVAGATSSFDFPLSLGAYDTVYNGLKDIMVFEMDISGFNQANAGFITDASACLNTSVNFINTSLNAISYQWDFDDGSTSVTQNPSHTFTIPGLHNVQLIVSGACASNDTMIVSINIIDIPVADFIINAQCSLLASFDNISTGANAYLWDFGDGFNSGSDSPIHTYYNTGNYTVMLIANPGSCPDTSFQFVNINSPPVATFTNHEECKLTYDFICTTSGTVSYLWDFGDGSTSSLVSVSHIYSLAGNYPVTLIVTDSLGCRDTVTLQVQVNPQPIAEFTFTPPLCAYQVSFQNNSQNATSYLWNFGDGVLGSGINVSHLFSSSGNFLVTLISQQGFCADSISQTITIYESPVSAFAGQAICDMEYSLVNISNGGVSYAWDFGDGSGSPATNPTHTYSIPGNFIITLITTNQYGCEDTTQQMITINNNPIADYTLSSFPCSLQVSFQNSSTYATSYLWDFDDGTFSTDALPVHTYLYSGTYDIKLVANPGGCPDSITQTVTVNRPPVAGFSFLENCSFDIQFLNSSDSATIYNWNFGDGVSAVPSPLHSFSTIGGHDVTLVALNNAGCADSLTRQIDVVVYSEATFISTYDTCLMQAQFISTSVNAGSYNWSFGDGKSSAENNPLHEYRFPGNFDLVFITNRGTLCADTITQAFDATPVPEHGFYVPNCFTPNGDGLNEQFRILDFGNCNIYHLMIFNRWGQMIFETDDLSQSWDGSYKGVPVPEDVYAYVLSGKDKFKQGSVLVLK